MDLLLLLLILGILYLLYQHFSSHSIVVEWYETFEEAGKEPQKPVNPLSIFPLPKYPILGRKYTSLVSKACPYCGKTTLIYFVNKRGRAVIACRSCKKIVDTFNLRDYTLEEALKGYFYIPKKPNPYES